MATGTGASFGTPADMASQMQEPLAMPPVSTANPSASIAAPLSGAQLPAATNPAIVSLTPAAAAADTQADAVIPAALLKAGNIILPSFNGNPHQLKNFIIDLEQCMELYGLDRYPVSKQILFAGYCLSGIAKTWWRDLCLKGVQHEWTCMKDFLDALIAEFLPSDLKERYRDRWQALPRARGAGGWQDINALERTVRELSMHLQDKSTEDVVHTFVSSLPPQIAAWVRMQHPASLDAAASAARDVQQSLRGGGFAAAAPSFTPFRSQQQYPQQQQYQQRPYGFAAAGPSAQSGPIPMELGSVSALQPIVCHHCGQPGHKRPDCPKLHAAKQRQQQQQRPGAAAQNPSQGYGRGRGNLNRKAAAPWGK